MNVVAALLQLRMLLILSMGWFLMNIPCSVQAQKKRIVFENFPSEAGLPSMIPDIAQDHQGYVWIATEDGLIRYDGYDFVTYINIPGDSTSLSQNRVEKLYVDFMGDLWIGSKSDLDRYNPACDCFVRYSVKDSPTGYQQAGQVNSFAEDKNNNLWIGTQQGALFRYNRKTNRFVRFLNDPAQPENIVGDEVREILIDRNNHLWIGTGEPFGVSVSKGKGGLLRLDLNTGSIKRFVHDPANPNSLLDNRVSALHEDDTGKLWIGTCQSGLHFFDPRKKEIVRITPGLDKLYAPQGNMGQWSSCPHVKFIRQSADGGFWVGTYNGGLNYYDPVSNELHHYTHDPNDPGSLSSDQVWCFLEDRQDRVWIGGLPGKLQKIEPSLHKFTKYTHDPKNPTGLSTGHVVGAYEAPTEPGVLWLGTRGGGLNRLDAETGRFTHFRHNPKDKNSIASDLVWTSYEDRNGTLWVGTEAGVDTLDRKTGKFTPFLLKKNNISTPMPFPVTRIHEDKQGALWLGTWSGGMIRLSKDKKSAKRYNFSNENQQSFYNSVFAIHEARNGSIWAGTFQGGLFQYNAQKDRFVSRLNGYGITDVVEDSTGIFWVGTVNGLVSFNPESGVFRQYSTKDGMPGGSVNGIIAGENGTLWLFTSKNIVRFEPLSGQTTLYGSSDGLTVAGFNQTQGFKSASGQLYFGAQDGLVSFDPKQLSGNPHPPDVLISSLQIAGKPFDLLSYKTNSAIQIPLSHQQNDLTFEYIGLHFTNPAKNTYKYRLYPYETEWVDASTQRTARYTNLDPGEYTFQVIASSSDGVWNKEGASMLLYIASPWWTRWWAYALLAGLLLGLGYWFYRFQLSRKLAFAESKRLKEIDLLKNSLYTNITHEFRTPLTVILGMADTLHSKAVAQQWSDAEQPLEMIHRNGENLLQLVNQMLDLSKLESGHLELEMLQSDVIPYIKYLCESFHSLAQEKHVDLSVHAEVDALLMDYDATKLATIISNLLSNAIKFTPEGGKVIVNLNQVSSLGQDHFSIKVKDTGKGIGEADIPYVFDRFYQADSSSARLHEGTGIGLALTKELVELMHGRITIKSQEGKGSEFMVEIPVTTTAPKGPAVPASSEIFHAAPRIKEASLLENDQSLDLPVVLIIEDNKDVVSYLILTLENKYHCIHAENGRIGLEMAYQKIPDIIICDVMMPGIDGYEVCATLKADERSNHIPIIMLTARVEPEDRLTGLSKGADAYLAKPFEKAELLIRLEKLLAIRQLLQQKYSSGLISNTHQNGIADNGVSKFMAKVEGIILERLEDEDFSPDQLGEAIHLSRSQVHRKIKALTGKSTSIYIRLIRLQKAKELLASDDLTISEVAYRVGFKSPVYFSQIFKETFGESPTASRD
ncbi:two-component regulator propeller domain-containing protein [Persicitalea sp.]|uniref:hybrid sensor histidine kinase/response regulator transcription factor n=1 Tax=Persicitalea sp. TaxID=3100273 RepID=UPI0035933620